MTEQDLRAIAALAIMCRARVELSSEGFEITMDGERRRFVRRVVPYVIALRAAYPVELFRAELNRMKEGLRSS